MSHSYSLSLINPRKNTQLHQTRFRNIIKIKDAKTKMEQEVLQFALLKKQLQKYKTLEKYILIKNSKEETFNNKKWNSFLPLFD